MDPIKNRPLTFSLDPAPQSLPQQTAGIDPCRHAPEFTQEDHPFFSPTHTGIEVFSECGIKPGLSALHQQAFLDSMVALAKRHDCRILQILDQANDKFNHSKIPTPDGRCHSISAIHAYSELHGEPEIWRTYAAPSNRHLGFSMIQRGGQNSENFLSRQIEEKLGELHAMNSSTGSNIIRKWRPGCEQLSRTQQLTFKSHVDDLLYKRRLSYVPGARAVTHRHLGEQLNLASMISALEPGVHLLRLHTPHGASHMLSCFVAHRQDRPSRLVEPNACEWEGEPDRLGALLHDFWLGKNLMETWCRGGSWEQLTYRLGIDFESDPPS